MITRKLLVSIVLSAGVFSAAVMPAPSAARVDVRVDVAPPPPRVEIVPEARRGWVWQPGYWDWRGNRHVWHKGFWVRERRGYAYHPHNWVERNGRWSLERGRWDRRDSDHDGVPNRRDRHPYNPNRS